MLGKVSFFIVYKPGNPITVANSLEQAISSATIAVGPGLAHSHSSSTRAKSFPTAYVLGSKIPKSSN